MSLYKVEMSKIIESPSKKFKVEIMKNGDVPHSSRVRLSDKDDNLIHEYVTIQAIAAAINVFVIINGTEWWIGGRHYMLRMFVNCETGQVFDDPDNRESSEEYKEGYEFIWTNNLTVSPKGNYLMVVGCMWAYPYQWKLYDISALTNNKPKPDVSSDMVRELSLYDHLRHKHEEDDEDAYADLDDDTIFTYEFVKDNEIAVSYIGEDKPCNTLDLFDYEATHLNI